MNAIKPQDYFTKEGVIPNAEVWKQVNSFTGQPGRPSRRKPHVTRYESAPRAATLTIPLEMSRARSCTIYHDGSSKIGFVLSNVGDYKISASGPKWNLIRIPARLSHLIPFGSFDVKITTENGMLVFDTAPLWEGSQI